MFKRSILAPRTSATRRLLPLQLGDGNGLVCLFPAQRTDRIDGAPSLSVVLSGRSPVTRQEERITLFTREMADDHIIYALFIAAERDYERLNETFNRMISSLDVGTHATHSSNTRDNNDRSVRN